MPYYAVYKGHETGVFTSYSDLRKNTMGFSGAIHKKFTRKSDAKYFAENGKDPNNSSIVVIIDNDDSKPEIKKEEMITVYTDGACKGNGSKNAKAGIGVYFGENDKRNVSRRVVGKQTNNTAELTAILEVSKILKKEIKKGIKVLICTDSQYSIKCCTTYGAKQAKSRWTDDIPNKDLVKEIFEAYKDKPNVIFKYVRAHTEGTDPDSIGNDHADRLANEAIGEKSCPYNEKPKKENSNIYLEVPYEQKDKAKLLGCKWDKKMKKWYVDNSLGLFSDNEIKMIRNMYENIM